MDCVAGVLHFPIVARIAIPEGVAMIVSRSCWQGAHWTVLREVRLKCPHVGTSCMSI
jgi:hypothetical protein